MRGTRILLALGTLALSAQAFTGTARADDPNDRMSPADIARDAAIIRKLNREQLDYVRRRDAGYAAGWKAYDEAGQGRTDNRETSSSRQSRAYAQARRDYEADLAQWRRDVAACRAGDYARCER